MGTSDKPAPESTETEAEFVKRLSTAMREARPDVSTWMFYDGMSRETFEKLKAGGQLPVLTGTYEETMALVGQRKAER